MTPARILHALAGAPEVDGCAPVDPCRCYMCAAPTERGAPVRRWMGSTFTDQPRCACPSSTVICEACVWACSWVVPPGHEPPPKGKKGVNLRLFSHLYDAGSYAYANKADKPSIRAFLRSPKRGPWFAAIADSGQKHTVPFAPMNLGAHGSVLFEDAVVELPDADGWRVLDDATDLLTAGATKDEIARGEYRPETWLRCRDRIEAFEHEHEPLRGGAFFDLVVWLAQRDEAAVAERQAREKAAKAAKKEAKSGKTKANGRTKRKAPRADNERSARDASGLPRGGRKPADSLEPARIEAPRRDEDERNDRGVGHRDEARTAPRKHEQISLFGDGDALD